MGFFDFLRRRPKYIYLKDECIALEKYIEEQYGKIDSVFHEIKSPDIHLDIYVIEPTEDAPYYKIITLGAGAYKMNVPKDIQGLGMDRAEFVVFLPSDWNIKSSAEEDYWPIRMMKEVGRLPILCKTWLGEGHSIASANGAAYAKNTKLNSCYLLYAFGSDGEVQSVLLPSEKKVHFYQIVPLYQEEMDYKLENGTHALVQRMNENEIGLVIDPKRKNVCK